MTAPKKKAKPRNRAQRRAAARAKPKEALVELIPGELKVFNPPTLIELLKTGTRARLEAFLDAHHGADADVVIHKAIEDFMVDDLADNTGVAKECTYKPNPKAD
jgi:hypothetical protein